MRVNLEPQQEQPYVFWLFDWGDSPMGSHLRLVPQYARCDVTKEQIAIYSTNQPLIIRLADIQEYKRINLYGNGVTANLKLVFTHRGAQAESTKYKNVKTIFLLPADALKHQILTLEFVNLYNVLHAYKSGQEPTLDKNPYHRMLVYHNQAHRMNEQTWDPTLHPSHYSPIPTVMGILKGLILSVIGVTLGGLLVIGLIYYIITTFF